MDGLTDFQRKFLSRAGGAGGIGKIIQSKIVYAPREANFTFFYTIFVNLLNVLF